MKTYTHAGSKSNVAYAHRSSRLFGHSTAKAGRRHALNGGPECFRSLCGVTVHADTHDEYGFRRENGPTNVFAAGCRPVTCPRCLKAIGK